MKATLVGFKIVAMCLTALFPIALQAQSIWLDRSQDKSIGLEVMRPNFSAEEGDEVSGLLLFLSLRAPMTPQFRFVGELPFVRSSYESNSFFARSGSQSTVGNPYLGFEIGQRGAPFLGEFGIRLPAASEDKFGAVLMGIVSDYDRLEAFIPNTVSITGMLNYCHREASGFALRLRGGPSLLLNTDEDDTELFIGYSVQAGYEAPRFSLLGGFTGRAIMTEEDADFDERSIHQLGFNVSAQFGKLRPGLHLRLPLDDDLQESLDAVLGFNLILQW